MSLSWISRRLAPDLRDGRCDIPRSDRAPGRQSAERGVSTVIGYALILGIVTVLISTVFLSMGPFVAGQADEGTRASLGVVGHHLGSDLRAVDRLANATGPEGRVELDTSLPERAGGSSYRIDITQTGPPNEHELTLRAVDSDVRVTVTIRTQIPIEETTGLPGGTLRIVYDADQAELVVRRG